MAKNLKTYVQKLADPASPFPEKGLKGKSVEFRLNGYFAACCHCCTQTKMQWNVPSGASELVIELWGGGGHGAGAACCQQGVAGGSGAYAIKTISATPGDAYCMCFEGLDRVCCWLRTTTGDTEMNHGARGGTVFVHGPGLTNFCAEGGNPGATCQCAWIRVACASQRTGGNSCNVCVDLSDIVGRSLEDSDNDIYNRACYYGADDGVRGNRSFAVTHCCFTAGAAEHCGVKAFIAYPPALCSQIYGVWSAGQGGWLKTTMAAQAGSHGEFACRAAFFGGYPEVWQQPVTGMGGQSAWVVGGSICCGVQGGHGKIRITYR
jgi:hypothetical protein